MSCNKNTGSSSSLYPQQDIVPGPVLDNADTARALGVVLAATGRDVRMVSPTEFDVEVPGREDITFRFSVLGGDADAPLILRARTDWDGRINDRVDGFALDLSANAYNVDHAAPRMLTYVDDRGHARIALDALWPIYIGITSTQLCDWVDYALSDVGDHFADITATVWSGVSLVPHIPRPDVAARLSPVPQGEVRAQLSAMTTPHNKAGLLQMQTSPVSLQRINTLVFGDQASEDTIVDHHGQGSVGVRWSDLNFSITVLDDLLAFDVCVHIGVLDRNELESLAAQVAATNHNITGSTAALINVGSDDERDWLLRSMIIRLANDVSDDQFYAALQTNMAIIAHVINQLTPGQ